MNSLIFFFQHGNGQFYKWAAAIKSFIFLMFTIGNWGNSEKRLEMSWLYSMWGMWRETRWSKFNFVRWMRHIISYILFLIHYIWWYSVVFDLVLENLTIRITRKTREFYGSMRLLHLRSFHCWQKGYLVLLS